MKIRITSQLFDKAGMSASIACAIHCALVPMLITFLPLWGIGFLADPKIEIAMLCISLCIGVFALSSAYKKHRKILPLLILVLGFVLIGIGHFIDQLENYLVPTGGLMIAAAHFINIKFTNTCSHKH